MDRKFLASAALLWLSIATLPAIADSRDQAKERMSRCDSLADTRQYLDCIYGAVQPLRSELGLAPAPQAASFTSLFAAPPVTRPTPPRQPEEAGLLGSVFSGITGTRTTAVPPEQFGLRNARPGPGRNVDRITARLTAFSLNRNTRAFTITLENGQVWSRGPSEEPLPPWKEPATSYVATIAYGAVGTFNLTIEGDRNLYKVQRVR
jgi:hypothetical protein